MRTTKNILQHELIGMEVRILDCPFPEKRGVEGTILDESRNMLVIESGPGEVQIPKHGSRFAFDLPVDETRPDERTILEIDGDRLQARPEDRVKRNEPKSRRK